MTERDRERLSALMDGEAGDHELRQVLAALDEDPALADTWKRFHLAQSALRRDTGPWAGVDLRGALAARLDAEDGAAAAPAPAAPRRRRGLQALASAAVAAGVTLATVFTWQSLQPGVADTATLAAAEPADQSVALGPMVVVREDGEELVLAAASPTAAQDRLNAYLARHARATGSLTSARGVVSYARVVSVEGEQAP